MIVNGGQCIEIAMRTEIRQYTQDLLMVINVSCLEHKSIRPTALSIKKQFPFSVYVVLHDNHLPKLLAKDKTC